MKRFALLAIALAAATLTARSAFAAAVELEAESAATEFDLDAELGMAEDPNDELLLLSPRIDGDTAGTSLPAYRRNGQIYLPLVRIAALVEFNLKRTRDGVRAAGWIGREDRTFSLDVTQTTVRFEGGPARFDPGLVLLRNEDIFVAAETLAHWLPLDFDVNPLRMTLDIKPREKTPYQLRKEREARLKQLRQPGERPEYPRYANEYRLLDGPYVNQTVSGTASKPPSQPARRAGSYATYAAADLLYLETHVFFTGNTSDSLADYAVYAGRRDYYGRLLGPLQAREFTLGDVYGGGLPLISASERTRGASVSSYPLSRPSNAFSHTFQGDLPAGWVVELYQDEFLLDYRRADVTGRYVFADVPMRAGANDFRLVFYGPYGQKYEESQTFNLAHNLAPQGELYYRASGGADLNGDGRGGVESDFGLTNFLSLHTGFSTVPEAGERRNFAAAGLRSAYGPVFLRTDVVGSSSGAAWQTEALTGYRTLSLTVAHTRLYRDFTSEAFASKAGLLRTASGRADLSIPPWLLPPLFLGVNVERDDLRAGKFENRVGNRVATTISELAVANRIDWVVGPAQRSVVGILEISRAVRPLGDVRLSGDFQYRLSPAVARGFGLAAEREILWGAIAHTGFRRTFAGDSVAEAGLNKEIGDFGISASGRFYHRGSREAFLQLSYGFGYVPQQLTLHAATNMASQGGLLVKAFFDNNQNGNWDAGEMPVANAQVMLDGNDAQLRTGRDGTAFLTVTNTYAPVSVSLTQPRQDETPWRSTVDGYTIVPRPGRTANLYFPVVLIGEVDGTVFVASPEGRTEQPGVHVELVDARNGAVVRTIVTAYDGYFYLNDIPPGKYRLRVALDDAKTLETRPSDERALTLTPKTMSYFGQDLTLSKP